MFGARGTGKSTLLKALFANQNPLWIDLLNQEMEFKLAQAPDTLLDLWKAKKSEWVIVDEVQKIPALLNVVHRGIEDHKIKFALTGSSARKLKRGGANLLAGRAASYELSTLSALELRRDFNLGQALATGLLQRFWSELEQESDRVRSLYSYVQTYLKEEVAAEQLVRNLDPFRRVLVTAAQMNAKILNYAKIERDAGVGSSQAERHFEILKDTWIGRELEPYSSSLPLKKNGGSLTSAPKMTLKLILSSKKPRGRPILIEIKSSSQLVAREDLRSFARVAKDFTGSEKYLLSNAQKSADIDGIQCLHWLEGLKQIFAVE